jgi:hypothetical protein
MSASGIELPASLAGLTFGPRLWARLDRRTVVVNRAECADAELTNSWEATAGIGKGTDSRSNDPFRRLQQGIAGKCDSCNPTHRLRWSYARTTGRNIPTKCGPGPTLCRRKLQRRLPSRYDALPLPSQLAPRGESVQRETGENSAGARTSLRPTCESQGRLCRVDL